MEQIAVWSNQLQRIFEQRLQEDRSARKKPTRSGEKRAGLKDSIVQSKCSTSSRGVEGQSSPNHPIRKGRKWSAPALEQRKCL